MADARIK